MLKLYAYLQSTLASLRDRQEGQTMAEYAVVLGVITVAIIVTFIALGGAIEDTIKAVISKLPGAGS